VYALVLPPWDLNDEEQHLGNSWVMIAKARAPIMGLDALPEEILDSAVATDRWRHFGIRRPQEMTRASIGLEAEMYQAYHPQLYYAILAPIIGAVGPAPLHRLLAGRLVSVVVVSATVMIVVLALRRLDQRAGAAAVLAGLWLAAIPERGLIGGRVTNDVLLELFGALLLASAVTTQFRVSRRRDEVLYGVIVGAALFVKASAVALLAPLGIVLGLSALGRSERLRHVLGRAAIVLLIGATIAVPSYLWNMASHGDALGTTAFLRLAEFAPRFTIPQALAALPGQLWLSRWNDAAPINTALTLSVVAMAVASTIQLRSHATADGTTIARATRVALASITIALATAPLLPFAFGVATGVIQSVEGRFVVLAYPATAVWLFLALRSGLNGLVWCAIASIATMLTLDLAFLWVRLPDLYYGGLVAERYEIQTWWPAAVVDALLPLTVIHGVCAIALIVLLNLSRHRRNASNA
jgi:4-amino-4-deoxy-L-arabinose transferase-like glycosyltransferase